MPAAPINPMDRSCRWATWLALFVAFLVANQALAEGNHDQLGAWEVKLRPGVYWPGPYYSRLYEQDHQLRPGQRILFYRMRPYQHYGEHKLYNASPPLTDGGIHSDRYNYRYKYGFEPARSPNPYVEEGCTDPPRSLRSLVSPATPIPGTPIPVAPRPLPRDPIPDVNPNR